MAWSCKAASWFLGDCQSRHNSASSRTPHRGICQSQQITLADSKNASDRVLVRYNGKTTCASSANRKLKDWMKKHGWNRNHGAHELRAYNGSVTATQTGSLIAAQNKLRHKAVLYHGEALRLFGGTQNTHGELLHVCLIRLSFSEHPLAWAGGGFYFLQLQTFCI